MKSGSNGTTQTPSKTSDDQKNMESFMTKLQPMFVKSFEFYEKIAPYLGEFYNKCDESYKKAKPYIDKYWFEGLTEIFLGVVLLFFGGNFAMTIACYTAVQLTGLDKIKESIRILKLNYSEALKAALKDKDTKALFDKDGDGRISISESLSVFVTFIKADAKTKKTMLYTMRGVLVAVEPQEVMDGITGLWSVGVTVIATLRSKFAKDVALGASLGDIASKSVAKYVKPIIKKSVPEDLKKWSEFIFDTIFKCLGITIALLLVKITSALQSSIKGGSILAKHLLGFLGKKGLMPKDATAVSGTRIDEQIVSNPMFIGIQYFLAFVGFMFQLRRGFRIFFPLNIILFPFTIFEMILGFVAAW